MNPFSFLSMGSGIAGGIMSMIGQTKQFDESQRLFKKSAGQQVGAATAAQASSGIDTIGGASPGAHQFLQTMTSEFDRQAKLRQEQFDSSIMAQSVGMALGSSGDLMKSAFQQADANKSGATFTSGLNAPAMRLTESNFLKGNLTGPAWGM